jgi:hypothetical protein
MIHSHSRLSRERFFAAISHQSIQAYMRRPEVGIIALAMLASACAFPTESPNWDMTWNLPVPDDNAMSIGVSTFLPSGVTLVTSGAAATPTAFNASVAAVPPISRTLGVQCPTCPSATAPKPAFNAPQSSTTISLAAGSSLTSATLFSGSQIVITLNNGFGFDPLNPPGGTPGLITLAVVNGTTTLGTLVLGGTATAVAGAVATTIPSGQSKNFTVNLSGTINTAQPISVTMDMLSPAGGTAASNFVTMNPNQVFTATAVPTVNISSANVTIAAQALSSTATPIDLSQVDSSVVSRITNDAQNRGAMFLTLTNPFTVGANATITFRSPTGTTPAITPITKNLTIAAATNATTASTSKVTINLTGKELRSIFGREIEAVFGGSTAAGSITVTPTQKISGSSRIQVNFTIREQK